MSPKNSSISFAQKFGLKYYAFTINLLIYVGVYELTRSMEIVLLTIVFLPRIGSFLPKDDVPKEENYQQINKNYYHMLAPAGSVLQLYYLIYYTWINYGEINHSYQSLISCILAFGVAGSQTIDASHELIHRNEWPLKLTGFFGLIPFLFTTYPIEHLYLHHKYVGSPLDDITAPKNSPFILYYFKSVFSSYRETFKYSKLFFAFCMSLHLIYLFALYQLALSQFDGNSDLAFNKMTFFIFAALFGLYMMESIEYIEHYGLIYRQNNNDKPVLQISSWNTGSNPVYNWAIFRFQRHSDHHMNAYKIFSTLQLNEKMPLFPFSFPEGINTAWFPPLWYRAMNHLVDKVMNQEKITKQDIQKSKFWVNVSSLITALICSANVYLALAIRTQIN